MEEASWMIPAAFFTGCKMLQGVFLPQVPVVNPHRHAPPQRSRPEGYPLHFLPVQYILFHHPDFGVIPLRRLQR